MNRAPKKIEDIAGRNWSKEISDELCKTHPQYAEKMEKQGGGRTLDWELCASGALSEMDLALAYSRATGLPIKDEEELADVEKYEAVPAEYLNSKCCLPFKWDDEEMEMLVGDPYEMERIFYMFRKLHGKRLKFSLARRSVMERKINSLYEQSRASRKDEPDFMEGGGSEEALRSLASEAKIVRLVNEMFARALEMEASDIHIEPEENRLVVRFRIDGILHETMTTPLNQYPAIASRVKLIGGLNIAENRLPQDGRTNLKIGKSDMDVRISTIPTMDGESIVLRILRKDAMEFNLKSVGMNPGMRESFERLISIPHGMILVVGPTGSGKTTTLYSTMTRLNTSENKIITIEDPVEYKIERLSQMQVNPKIGLTFAGGLRHIVRQDPDIILVGEIRDKETADIAINAALTGHLVLSTLHTNDAAGAISRLIDMGVEGFLISSALYGVLSQRLVRKICDKCRGSGHEADSRTKCKKCSGTGFRGRTGIFELLLVDDKIRAAIAANKDSSVIAAIARENGMVPILEDGRKKVEDGVTTESELLRAAANL